MILRHVALTCSSEKKSDRFYKDLLGLDKHRIRKIRGNDISMIFQEPMTSLNPLLRIGDQLTETMLTHLPIGKEEAEQRAIAALDEVGIPGAAERIGSYPHEFSGGQCQRIGIARALLRKPGFLVLDEPTAALDSATQARLMEALGNLEHTMSVVLITHRPELLKLADRVVDLEDGTIKR